MGFPSPINHGSNRAVGNDDVVQASRVAWREKGWEKEKAPIVAEHLALKSHGREYGTGIIELCVDLPVGHVFSASLNLCVLAIQNSR